MKFKKLLICTLLLFGYGHMQADSMSLSQLTTSSMSIIGLSISVNSSGNAMAVWGNSSDNSIYASFYNGSGWSTAVVIDGGGGGLSPWVSLNDSNKAVAVWQTSLVTGDVKSNTYFSGGWQTAQTIVSTVNFATDASYPLSRMRVGVDPSGNAVAVWVAVDNAYPTTPNNWYVKTSVSIDNSGNSTGNANNWANTGQNILNSNNTGQQVFFDPNSQVFMLINQTAVVSWVQNNNSAYIARYLSSSTNVSPSIISYANFGLGSATSNCFDINQAGDAFAATVSGNSEVYLDLQPSGGSSVTECHRGAGAGNTVYSFWTALSNATDPLLHQAVSFNQSASSPFTNKAGYRIALQSPVESLFQSNCALGLFPKNNVLDIDYNVISPRLNPMICSYSDNTAALFWNSQGTPNNIGLMQFDGQSWNTQGIQFITAHLPAATSPSLDMPFYATCSRNVINGQHYAGLIWWDSSVSQVFAIMSNGTSTPFGPSPASNVTAVATDCGTSSPIITIGWQTSPDSDISAQYVYRNNGPGSSVYTPVSGALGTGVTSYPDSSISSNIIYSYFVRVTNTAGLSSESAIVTDECATNKPAAPILSAQGSTLNGAPVAVLTWNYQSNGTPLTGFQLWRTGSGSETLIADETVLTPATTTYTDTTITTGTNYTYYLYAINGTIQSDPSNNASVEVSVTPPGAPSELTATCNSPSSVILNWTPGSFANATPPYSQAIYRTGVYVASVSPSTTTYTDNTIVSGKSYTYSVYSVAGKNPAQYSKPDSIYMPGCTNTIMPSPPSGVTASDSSTGTTPSITITWSASSTSGAKYNIYLSGTSTPIAKVDPAQNGNQYVYVDTQVAFGNSYSYDVSAVTANGESSLVPSNEVTPQQNAPSAFVADPSATCMNSGTAIELTWIPPADSCGSQEVWRTDIITPLTTINNCTNTPYAYTDSTITGTGIAYTYYIRAYNSTGSAFRDSNPITIECFASAPDAPIDVEASCILDVENDTPALLIQWQVPSLAGIVGQRVYRNNDLIATATANATSFIDTSIAQGLQYSYNIATVNSVGATAKSRTVTGASCKLGTTELFTGTCGFNQFALEGEYFVTLKWTIPSTFSANIGSQIISRDGVVIATLDSTQRQYIDSNRPAGATSTYTLDVKNKTGVIDVNGTISVTC